ncbi:Hypothetical protein I595_1673 [Croceitalea dokdonensis DOKDO 023]|uniref:Polysaccharide biosynthesis protein n=1 Tax=Croceitalea dokdonensis DOKDO 023 TaxID=1300341 RepID=A0A0P7AVT1_9FLAO|nr:hypothetical protein [Croceitalea dokdonensis]KPM32025.1 Hypothetical protein I595_1673 [Croceitalea dokdonensis DOKDO 023]
MGRKKNFEKLKKKTFQRVGIPVGEWTVLATIESFGIREVDAKPDYGYDSLVELAHAIEESIAGNTKDWQKASKNGSKLYPVNAYMQVPVNWFFQYYISGLVQLFPILIQIIAIIYFNYSLWTYLDFNLYQSTAVVLGVILGFVISGGFVQVIGRQSFFYWQHKKYDKAKDVIYTFLRLGAKGMVLALLVLIAVNFFFNLYTQRFMLVLVVYAFLVGFLLITLAPFHPLNKRSIITLSISVATILALVLFKFTDLHVYFTHWLGIGVAILINLLCLKAYLPKQKISETVVQRPRKLMVAYKTYRYFFYGILIFVFFFIDRLLAWSVNTDLNSAFIFQYEKNYEIGMDLAILMFFSLAGVLEYAISTYSRLLDQWQKSFTVLEANRFNQKFKQLYNRHLLVFLVTSVVAGLLIYLIITQPWGYLANFGVEVPLLSIHVCLVGAIGYVFLTLGMMNVLYMFTLNRSKEGLNALIVATLANFIIGFLSSRFISYEYSVVGLLFGAMVFMVMTTHSVKKFFKKMDYEYYAAY